MPTGRTTSTRSTVAVLAAVVGLATAGCGAGPADLMQPSMQMMEISLGVHCVYCHDPDATKRDLDTNPRKEVARGMLRMVDEINKTTFKGQAVVNCYTCHRGDTHPVSVSNRRYDAPAPKP